MHNEAKKLQEGLGTNYIGKRVMWFKSLSSTQFFAKNLIATKGILYSNGHVIISERQINGTGRWGSNWVSPKGGIWLSLIISPALHPSKIALFSFCASLSVSEAICICTGIHSKLKWPNDVLIQGKKVSGILIDASINSNSIEHLIVGIGVNANVEAAQIQRQIEGQVQPHPVTSIKDQLGTSCDILELTKCILQKFDEHYSRIEADKTYPLLEKWKERAEPIICESVHISRGAELYTAKVMNYDEDGSLVVKRDDNRIERITTAEYHVRVTS